MRGAAQFHPPVQLLVSLDAQFAHGIALMAINGFALDAKEPCGVMPAHPYGQVLQHFSFPERQR